MSDLGNLSNCVMDSDPDRSGWARRLRRRAFMVSLVLEAALVGAMLLWPLITPAVLPAQLAMTPVPPYHPERSASEVAPSRENARPAMYIDTLPNPLHPTVHRGNPLEPDGEPPNPGDFPIGGGSASGPSIPGGSSDGRSIEVPRPALLNRPVNMSAGVMAALLVHRVQPDYPKLAQFMHLSGTVELQARIGTDGTVQQLEVVSGNPILAQAAVEAVQQWRYQPTRLAASPSRWRRTLP